MLYVSNKFLFAERMYVEHLNLPEHVEPYYLLNFIGFLPIDYFSDLHSRVPFWKKAACLLLFEENCALPGNLSAKRIM